MKMNTWLDKRTLWKTASYWVLHVSVAAMVAFAVTGDLLTSLTLSLLEPTVQAFAFFGHEKCWERGSVTEKIEPTAVPSV